MAEAQVEGREEEEEEEECPKCVKGAPAWMATFADMATLLMAFFVLILSFAEFNVPKFKQISGCLLYTSPSPRDRTRSRMPSSA